MRILVVDDHELVRRGICSVLAVEPTLTICGQAIDGQDAVEKAVELRPDVVVMDISMPRLNGLEATRQIKRILPQAEVVIVSQHNVPEMVRQAFNAGAHGYVTKSAISTDLLTAITRVGKREQSVESVGLADSNPNLDPQEILERSAAFEKALRESEERFRSAMNNLAEGLYTVDIQGRVTYINPSAEAMFGWTSAELLGKNIHESVHYKHSDGTPFPAAGCHLLAVLHTGTAVREHEDEFIRKDGSFFPVIFSATPLKENGKITGIVVGFRDDTNRRQTEESLRRSERIYRAIGESIDYGIWIADPNGRNIYASPSFLNLVGLTQEQCSEFGWMHVLHSDDAASILADWKECIRAGAPWEREVRFRGVDGNWHHILARGGPIRDSQGQIICWAGTNLDVQQRNESEHAKSLLAAIVDSSDDAIISKNLDGVITSWNPAAERMFGYKSDEAIGRHVTLIIPPDRRDEETSIVARLKRGERIDHFETVRMRKDGTMRDISLTISPVKDAKGNVFGASKVARDITERKKAEPALRESEERFRAIVETTPECVKLVRTDGTLLHMNSSGLTMVGADCAEMVVGKNVYDLIAPQDRDRFRAFNESICRGSRGSLEFDLVGLNGTHRRMETHAAPFRMSDGTVVQLAVTRDVTERSRAENELRKSEERLRELADGLETQVRVRTQELEQRNSEIIRQSEQLRELSNRLLQTQDEERRRIARELHDGVGQLIAALGMNLSNLMKERAKLTPDASRSLDENVDLIGQASQEIRTMSHLLHPPLLDEVGLESALRWFVDGFTERSKVTVDLQLVPGFSQGLPRELALSLFRIVQESLTNVHRHSGSAKAFVGIVRSAGTITLEVRDEGRGIPPDIRSKISSGESTGVGLRGMRERIRQFGGRLDIFSTQEGTRIVAFLPLPELDQGEEKSDPEAERATITRDR
jgi:PAS domain S-box-containing protein